MRAYRFVIFAMLMFFSALSSYAETPVQTLVADYGKQKGVKVMNVNESFIGLARRQIRKSPLAPLADNVNEVTILTMKKSPDQTKEDFLQNLEEVLKSYQYYGKKLGMEMRVVDVYGDTVKDETVHELIVFNPEDYSLFSLRGCFPVKDLMAIDNK